MNYKAWIISLLSTVFIAACAQTPTTEGVLTFEEMDRDANGYISAQEAKASSDINKNFKAIDSNGDGKINITEFQDHMGKGRMTPPEEMETPEPGAAPY